MKTHKTTGEKFRTRITALGAGSFVFLTGLYFYYQSFSSWPVDAGLEQQGGEPLSDRYVRDDDGELLYLDQTDQIRAGLNSAAIANNTAENFGARFRTLIATHPESASPRGANSIGDDLYSPVKKTARKAFELVTAAARSNDKSIFDAAGTLGQDCWWCDEFYQRAARAISDPNTRSDERAYLSRLLTGSGKSENIKAVVDSLQHAANNPQEGLSTNSFVQALREAELDDPAVDLIAQDLASVNPYLREAAVSILTKQSTLEAAQRLYQHTVERGDPDGYHSERMGLGVMKPGPEAVGYLEGLVRQNDQYSHLAVKALLNTGAAGLDRIGALLEPIQDIQVSRGLLKGAFGHVSYDPASLAALERIGASSSNKAFKDFANQVLKEYRMGRESLDRKIEYNENFEKGLIF